MGIVLTGLVIVRWFFKVKNFFHDKAHYIFQFFKYWILLYWPLSFFFYRHCLLQAQLSIYVLTHIQNRKSKTFLIYDVSLMVVKFNRSKNPGPVCSGILSILFNFPFLQNGHVEISWPVNSNMSSSTDLFDTLSGILFCPRIFRHFNKFDFLQRFAKIHNA